MILLHWLINFIIGALITFTLVFLMQIGVLDSFWDSLKRRRGEIFMKELKEEIWWMQGKPSEFDPSKEWKKVMTKEEKEE